MTGRKLVWAVNITGTLFISAELEFYAADTEIARLRSTLLAGGTTSRLSALVALAWHQRQRDSSHALELAAAADAMLAAPDPSRADIDQLRARLCLVRAEVAGLYTDFDAAAAHLAKAVALYQATDDSIGLGDAACVDALLARHLGHLRREHDQWVAAAACFAQAGDAVRRAIAEAWAVLAQIPLVQNGERAPPNDLTELPTPGGSRAVEALRWAGAGLISEGSRDASRSATAWTRAYANALKTGLVYIATYAALMSARAFRRLGDPEAAKDWCERGFDMARPTGWPHLLGACHMLLGSLLYDLKEMERSHEALTEALPLAGPNTRICHLFLARTLIALDRPEAALEAIDATRDRAENAGDPLTECAMLVERARALAKVSRLAEAADQIAAAQAMARTARISTYDVGFLEIMATLHESGYVADPNGPPQHLATYDYLKRALETGSSRRGWRPTNALLKRLARAATANEDFTAAISYYERALEAADFETAKRLQNRVAAIQIQEDLLRAKRDAELHLQRRRAVTESKRADELQDALDAMKLAQETLAERTEEFERLSLLDPLTGIANRRHLEQRASSEIAMILRKSTQLGVIMFDIDHFKGVNDAHGHGFGDRVICEVVETARAQLRPSDFIARIGGEEFTILLPDADVQGGEIIANRIRAAISGRSIRYEGAQAVVTASFGVTVLSSKQPSLEVALKRADDALYVAKNNGRNLVCVDSDPFLLNGSGK